MTPLTTRPVPTTALATPPATTAPSPAHRARLACALLATSLGLAAALPARAEGWDRWEPGHHGRPADARDGRRDGPRAEPGRAPVAVVPPAVVSPLPNGGRIQFQGQVQMRGPDWGDVRVLPRGARVIPWQGERFAHWNGLWWRPGAHGYVAVRPPIGLWVDDLPLWRSVLVVGGITYFVANGVWYRGVPSGGYEVVETPASTQALVVVPPSSPAPVTAPADPPRQFVYPRNQQSAEQQAADEYACYRWAVAQSGYDPVASALGNAPRPPAAADSDAGRPLLPATGAAGTRADHDRARAACLDARGYTVR